MKKIVLILFVAFSFYSCKKCEQCYLIETVTSTGASVETDLGEYCGDELDDIDGSNYIGNSGPVTVDCRAKQ